MAERQRAIFRNVAKEALAKLRGEELDDGEEFETPFKASSIDGISFKMSLGDVRQAIEEGELWVTWEGYDAREATKENVGEFFKGFHMHNTEEMCDMHVRPFRMPLSPHLTSFAC